MKEISPYIRSYPVQPAALLSHVRCVSGASTDIAAVRRASGLCLRLSIGTLGSSIVPLQYHLLYDSKRECVCVCERRGVLVDTLEKLNVSVAWTCVRVYSCLCLHCMNVCVLHLQAS